MQNTASTSPKSAAKLAKMHSPLGPLLLLTNLAALTAAACLPSGDASTVNTALASGGAGAIIQLCPNALITVTTAGITFTAENQELSTQGYPTDSTRATVLIAPGSSITSAIWGRWTSGVKVLNLQVDGNRPNAGLLGGDALIEMGGGAAGQVVSWSVVKNTRSWSCLHYIGSGQDDNPCREGTVTYNTIGPCGNEGSDENGNARWADGVSFECVNSEVSYNDVSGDPHLPSHSKEGLTNLEDIRNDRWSDCHLRSPWVPLHQQHHHLL